MIGGCDDHNLSSSAYIQKRMWVMLIYFNSWEVLLAMGFIWLVKVVMKTSAMKAYSIMEVTTIVFMVRN